MVCGLTGQAVVGQVQGDQGRQRPHALRDLTCTATEREGQLRRYKVAVYCLPDSWLWEAFSVASEPSRPTPSGKQPVKELRSTLSSASCDKLQTSSGMLPAPWQQTQTAASSVRETHSYTGTGSERTFQAIVGQAQGLQVPQAPQAGRDASCVRAADIPHKAHVHKDSSSEAWESKAVRTGEEVLVEGEGLQHRQAAEGLRDGPTQVVVGQGQRGQRCQVSDRGG